MLQQITPSEGAQLSSNIVLCVDLLFTYTLNKYRVLGIQFRSVKCTVVTRLRKNFEQFFMPFQVIKDDYSALM